LIAKDIDTPEMLQAVRQLPIQFGQGDAIAEGMGIEDLAEFLRTR
jgi:EAL domain-containing protein (putative c-di-GMP-specific phosphodiesterase class I)